MSKLSKFCYKGGYVMAKNRGKETRVAYCRPKNANDLKRSGRSLSISVGNTTMVLNGKQLRSIKSVLQEAGEVLDMMY